MSEFSLHLGHTVGNLWTREELMKLWKARVRISTLADGSCWQCRGGMCSTEFSLVLSTVCEVYGRGFVWLIDNMLPIYLHIHVYTSGLSLLMVYVCVVIGCNKSRWLAGLYIFTVNWILWSTDRSGGCWWHALQSILSWWTDRHGSGIVWWSGRIWGWYVLLMSLSSFCSMTKHLIVSVSDSVLWCCWLGGRNGIWPVKNWVVGCWHGYMTGSRWRFAYDLADATATHCLLLQ